MQSSVRKMAFLLEETAAAGDESKSRRITGMAVLTNPCVGDDPRPLSALSEIAVEIGDALTRRMLELLAGPAVSYGKAAIIGTLGEAEHGAALLHPTLGRSIRGAIGGGAALIPSNAKVAAIGSMVDVPIGHRDEAWSFAHIDTVTTGLADAPLPSEVLLIIVLAGSARANARVTGGTPPATTTGKR